MQHFLHTTPPDSGSGLVVREWNGRYAEFLRQPVADDPTWFSSYIVHIDDGVMAAMTCWDQQFDPLIEQLSNPQHGAILADEFKKIWPTMFQLLANTVDERYGDGAIAEFIDPDDMNSKWFIAVLINTAAVLDPEEELSAAANTVFDLSFAVALEFENELSWRQKAKIAVRGGAAGYRRGKKVTGPWEERLGWLQGMLGQ